MSQFNKTHARQGRGVGNGHNDNWRNSPLWDSIDKKNAVEKEEPEVEEVKLDDLDLKARMKRLQAMAY